MKVMFDTNIFDRVIAMPCLIETLQSLSVERKLDIIITHIQEDELQCIPDPAKRAAIMQVPRRAITTSGAIYRVSKYGRAKYGDGSSQGLRHSDIHKNNPDNAEDAIITMTSMEQVDVFVTEDRRLRNRIKRLSESLVVWSFDDFVNYTTTLKEEQG